MNNLLVRELKIHNLKGFSVNFDKIENLSNTFSAISFNKNEKDDK